MTDPFLTRDWADSHTRFSGDLGRGVDRLLATLKASLDYLNAYQFDAPWHRERKSSRRRKGAGLA